MAERVIRLGKIDVATLLAAADVVALRYRMTIGQAAFPGVIHEAMAMAMPLVTTDLPLLREVVEDGYTALLCPPENPAALARKVVILLADRDLARRMVVNQAAVMAGRFRPAFLAQQYERVYGDVLGERTRVLQPAGRGQILRLPFSPYVYRLLPLPVVDTLARLETAVPPRLRAPLFWRFVSC